MSPTARHYDVSRTCRFCFEIVQVEIFCNFQVSRADPDLLSSGPDRTSLGLRHRQPAQCPSSRPHRRDRRARASKSPPGLRASKAPRDSGRTCQRGKKRPWKGSPRFTAKRRRTWIPPSKRCTRWVSRSTGPTARPSRPCSGWPWIARCWRGRTRSSPIR